MGDLLSAASLILAVIGMLYGLWYPEIQKTLDLKLEKYEADRILSYKTILKTFWNRSLPLGVLALLDSLIFMPDTVKKLYEIYGKILTSDVKTFFIEYDSVGVAFCAVELITIGMAFHVILLSYKLLKMRFSSKPDSKNKA